jgi:hypothetical protein
MVATVREGIHGGNRQRRNPWWQPSEKESMVATVRKGNTQKGMRNAVDSRSKRMLGVNPQQHGI